MPNANRSGGLPPAIRGMGFLGLWPYIYSIPIPVEIERALKRW